MDYGRPIYNDYESRWDNDGEQSTTLRSISYCVLVPKNTGPETELTYGSPMAKMDEWVSGTMPNIDRRVTSVIHSIIIRRSTTNIFCIVMSTVEINSLPK